MADEIQLIMVDGRRWNDTAGNTYHSVMVRVLDGHKVLSHYVEPYSYGYGNQWEDTALDLLVANGVVDPEQYANGSREMLWQWCDRHGITYERFAVDVPRRRDLHNGGRES